MAAVSFDGVTKTYPDGTTQEATSPVQALACS